MQNVSIVVFGQPYTGTLIPPATEDGFEFQPNGSTDRLTFRWKTLEPSERDRIRKLVGLDGGGKPAADALWGENVDGVRLKLKTGRFVEGLALPDRARPGFKCVKTNTKIVMIPEPDIASEEKASLKESHVYSPEEAYERLMARRPPANGSANDHLDVARTCVKMNLFEKALEHLELAKASDPRTEESNKAFQAEVLQKYRTQRADDLYARLTTALQAEDFGTALARCDDFIRSFPEDERRTRLEKLRLELEPKKDASLQRQTIRMYYSLMTDLLQKRMGKKIKIDEKGLPVPAVPGKQVTLRDHRMVRGLPVADDAEKVVVRDAEKTDLTIEIPRKEILAVEDIDLSKGVKMVDPTFEELKAYATGEDGLGTDIVARIAKTLRIPEAQVRELWESRFARTAVVEDGVLKAPTPLTAVQTAGYGEASWLRNAPQGGSGTSPTSRNNTVRRNTRRTSSSTNTATTPLDPKDSDDPEVWWSVQSAEAKLNILRAFAAENIFKVRDLQGKPCPECSGRGITNVAGATEQRACPVCRGLKQLVTVIYE